VNRLVIVGASGHGRVAADCAVRMNAWTEIVFLDDRWPAIEKNLNWPVVGAVSALSKVAAAGDEMFVAIGNAKTRVALLTNFHQAGRRLATIIHPFSSVSYETKIDPGTIVVAGAVVNIGVRVGLGCIINTGSSVDHDCTLADGVHVCPGARLAGDVKVGAQSWVGIGAVVRQGLTIGSNVMIGAGAAVVNDIPNEVTVTGIPARIR
jgi:sugar O-acyltransferase (sialic acid O-acetyltransferase NeuD family)